MFPKPMKLVDSKVIRQKPKIKLLLKILWVGASLEIDLISSPVNTVSFNSGTNVFSFGFRLKAMQLEK